MEQPKMATREEVMQALAQVMDPELGKDIVKLGMVKSVDVDGDAVRVEVQLTTPACPLKHVIRRDVEAAVKSVPGVASVTVELGASVTSRPKEKGERLPTVRNVIAVGAGKGGVGKSTVAVNLAVALAKNGARVGLLDADLHGPSVPMMLGLANGRVETIQVGDQELMAPLEAHGLKFFSMGLLLGAGDAVVWRGPMLHKAITQFLEDVYWGDLDYLVVDLPPGTGDVQISLASLVPISSAVVVTTPQDIAFADVRRAVKMFEITKVPVMGLVENMASFSCPGCGTIHHPFGAGRVRELAEGIGLALLGEIPLDPRVSTNGDLGIPIVIADPDGLPALALARLAGTVAARQSVLNMGPG
jgi:ATP-binding protein involved in chromosome partitioning